jgi:hypothetical protein
MNDITAVLYYTITGTRMDTPEKLIGRKSKWELATRQTYREALLKVERHLTNLPPAQ